jgi:hypothetical protein
MFLWHIIIYAQANSSVISLEYTDSSETNSVSIMTVLIQLDTQPNEIIQYTETRHKEHSWHPMSWLARRANCGRTYYGYGTRHWTHQWIEIRQSNRLHGVLGEGANKHTIKVIVLFSLSTIVYLLYLPTYHAMYIAYFI